MLNNVLPTVVDWYREVNVKSMLQYGHSSHINQRVVEYLRDNGINFIPFGGRGSHT